MRKINIFIKIVPFVNPMNARCSNQCHRSRCHLLHGVQLLPFVPILRSILLQHGLVDLIQQANGAATGSNVVIHEKTKFGWVVFYKGFVSGLCADLPPLHIEWTPLSNKQMFGPNWHIFHQMCDSQTPYLMIGHCCGSEPPPLINPLLPFHPQFDLHPRK